jgi:hypothetical protein
MSSARNLEAGDKNILASCYDQVSYLVLYLTREIGSPTLDEQRIVTSFVKSQSNSLRWIGQ